MVYENGFRLKDSVYNFLKWICLIVLPALSVLYGTLAGIWNFPFATQIPLTIDSIDVFLGALIGVSQINYNKEGGNDEA